MKKVLFSLAALSLTVPLAHAQMPYPYMPTYPQGPMAPAPYGMPIYPIPYGYPVQPPTLNLPAPAVPAAVTPPAVAAEAPTPASQKAAEPSPPAPAALTETPAAAAPAPVAETPPAPAPTAAAPAPTAATPATPAPAAATPSVAAPAAQAPAAPVPAPAAVAAPVPQPAPVPNPWLQFAPPPTVGFNPFVIISSTPKGPLKPYSMRRIIPQQEKVQMMQMMLPMMTTFMRMGMPDMMNYMARKIKAKPGLTFDDVRDSLFLRANQLNMKKVGENLMWKDFHVVLEDKEAPRIEVYSFCDIAVGRDLLKISPEFIVFLPCRVAIMEDANKEIWVLMIDWNMDWVAGFEKQLGLSDELVQGAKSINDRMVEMMQAAANGDL